MFAMKYTKRPAFAGKRFGLRMLEQQGGKSGNGLSREAFFIQVANNLAQLTIPDHCIRHRI